MFQAFTEPSQLRGWGPQHRRQSHQGDGHGEDAQGIGNRLVHNGIPTRGNHS